MLAVALAPRAQSLAVGEGVRLLAGLVCRLFVQLVAVLAAVGVELVDDDAVARCFGLGVVLFGVVLFGVGGLGRVFGGGGGGIFFFVGGLGLAFGLGVGGVRGEVGVGGPASVEGAELSLELGDPGFEEPGVALLQRAELVFGSLVSGTGQ